ncbi:MAG: hypothetical protein NTY90_04725 [Candidatus Micrarchaeota archaeon]|nr:hypothetical protein [Candidatus Micrarchaeota archaeon]
MKVHQAALNARDLDESVSFYKRFSSFTEAKGFGRKDSGGKAAFSKARGNPHSIAAV